MDESGGREARERDFHNRRFADTGDEARGKFYWIDRASRHRFRDLVEVYGRHGTRVLEFGCGPDPAAIELAKAGASVTGIDVSDVAVEQAKARAVEEGVTERTDFVVMNAERLAFASDSFDLVCGMAILHHLDLDEAYAGIARVLRDGGAAVFLEPLGHNPVINAYRDRTPGMRTADEHPLMWSDLEHARRYFGQVDASFFHLTSLAAVPWRDRPGFRGLVRALDAVDRTIFRAIPYMRRHAWMTVTETRLPRRFDDEAPTELAAAS